MPDPIQPMPFRVVGPQPPVRPVLLTVPHAGRAYPAELIAAARVPLAVLRRLEDMRADLLVNDAVDHGFTAIIADAPRALIDLNRAEVDCDPCAISGSVPGLRPSLRARGGLGLLPHRLHPEGDLWRERPSAATLASRIETIHRPWHAAIECLLGDIRGRLGPATLLDVHSMPASADGVELALGDRYGRTAPAEFADRLLAVAEGHGVIACRNHPYAGAFGIERHARPERGVQALQLEWSRGLYLTAAGGPDPAGIARIGRVVTALANAAARDTEAGWLPVAAE